MLIKENELKVYKANRLIEARYSLSLNEQKLVLFAASRINNFIGKDFTILRMPVVEFFRNAGLEDTSKNHSYIKNVVKGLMGKQLEIEYVNGDWELIQWVSRCKYESKNAIIEFEFSQALKPYLLELEENYRGYPLKEVMKLNSKYSIRLYELLIQWEYTTHKSLNIELEELRKKMGVLNNEYERFTDFENRVIKTAVKELNKESNIFVNYEKIKKGRSIDSIKFKFEIKNDEKKKQIEVMSKLKEAGLTLHVDEIKRVFNDNEMIFSDLELDKIYLIVYNKLVSIQPIQNCLDNAIYRYMLYYYEYTKEKAGKHAYNYYLKLVENDYAMICQLYKFGRSPESIVYGELL